MARITLAGTMRAGVSVAALLWSGTAFAQCNVTGTGTLADLNANDIAGCSGTVNSPVIGNGAGTNETNIRVIVDSATINDGNFTFTGGAPGALIDIRDGATLNNSVIDISGPFQSITIDASEINVGGGFIRVSGADSGITMTGGSTILGPGGGTAVRLLGAGSSLDLQSGGAIYAGGGVGVQGGAGTQYINVNGLIDAGPFGTAMDLGDGDDQLSINSLGGGIGGVIEMGAGNDVIRLAGPNGLLEYRVSGAEEIYVQSGGWTLFEVTDVQRAYATSSGTLTLAQASLFGDANTVIQVDAGSVLRDVNGGQPQQVLAGEITGDGVLEVYSANGLVLGRANSFTGGTTIDGSGLVILNHGDALGSGAVVNNGTLRLGNIVFRNSIDGAGGVQITGGALTEMTAVNTYAGGTHIINGTLQVSNEKPLGTGGVVIEAAGKLRLTPSDPETFTLNISGDGGVEFMGTGRMTINTANSYIGGTLIGSGVVVANHAEALGGGMVTNNALLHIGGVNFANQISGTGVVETSGNAELGAVNNNYTGGTVIAGGSLTVSHGGALGLGGVTNQGVLILNGASVSAAISGAGSIETSGTSAALGGNNSYSGGTTITNGVLTVTHANALGSSAVNNMGVLYVSDIALANSVSGNGTIETSGNVELTGTNSHSGGVTVTGGRLTIRNVDGLGSGALTNNGVVHLDGIAFSAPITGTGALETSGTVALSGSSSFTGGTTILSGSLSIVSGDPLGTGAVTNNALLIVNDVNLSNAISGSGAVHTTGTVRLLGANSYSGGTHILDGSLLVANGNQLGSGAVTNDGMLRLSGATIGNAISGAGSIETNGNSALTAANSYTGLTMISGGTLTVSATGALGTGSVSNGGALRVNGAGVANVISGSGSVETDGTSSLSGSSSYSGGTTIMGGTLTVSGANALGTGAVANSGVLRLNGATVGNVISGSGSVESAGISGLSGANSHSGGTTITGGTLTVSGASALGSGAVTNSGVLRLNGATVANAISGSGSLESAGTSELSAANSYTGGTTVTGGTLTIGNGGALGTGAVVNDATLRLGGVTLANNVSGTGAIESAGTSQLIGTNTHSGGTRVTGGTLRAANVAALGSGGLNVATGATFDADLASNGSYAGALSGGGALVKRGVGTLTLTGGGTIGSVAVNAGRLALNSNVTGTFSVANGGTLGGTGRVIGNLTNAGIVAPGNSIGTLTVQGNYTHASNAVLEIEFDASGNIDLLDVTGTATLNGGTLRFVSIGGAEGNGGTFLRATGGVTGTFSTIETQGAQIPLAVIYNANNAQMAPSILSARPSTFDSQALGSADASLAFTGTMLTAQRHGVLSGNRLWLQAMGSTATRDPGGATLGFRHNSWGLAGGADFALSETLSVGIAGGWSKGDITLRSNGGSGDIDSMMGAIHLRYEHAGFVARGGLMLGTQGQKTRRNIAFNGFAATVEGATDSTVYGGFAGVTVPLADLGGWALSGDASAALVHQEQSGYAEGGISPLRLAVAGRGVDTAEARIGLDLGRATPAERQVFQPNLRLGARHVAALGDRGIPVTFAASGTPILLPGDDRGIWEGYVGASARWELRGNIAFELGYDGSFGGPSRHAGRAAFTVGF